MTQPIPSVWMITDLNTGEPSYFHVDGTNQVIGPFAYTSAENGREALRTHSFFPQQDATSQSVTEVEGMGFVTGILTRFEPSNTDVVVLDDGFLPLTESGAGWVDSTIGKEEWRLLWGGDPSKWMDVVLKAVSDRLGIDRIRVALKRPESPVSEALTTIEADVVFHVEPEPFQTYGVVAPEVNFRVFTRGMELHDRPNLEMGGVPPLFAGVTRQLLKSWAAYSLAHPLKAGMTLIGGSDPLHISLRVTAVEDRLRFEVDQVVHAHPSPCKQMH